MYDTMCFFMVVNFSLLFQSPTYVLASPDVQQYVDCSVVGELLDCSPVFDGSFADHQANDNEDMLALDPFPCAPGDYYCHGPMDPDQNNEIADAPSFDGRHQD